MNAFNIPVTMDLLEESSFTSSSTLGLHLLVLIVGVAIGSFWTRTSRHPRQCEKAKRDPGNDLTSSPADSSSTNSKDDYYSVLPCIRNRRSIFPKGYLRDPPPLDPAIIQSLLDAALWGPFHGKCFKGCQHPARFVVLGKQSMIDMQHMTLQYYDKNWQKVGWGSNQHGTPEEYQKWRRMTEGEIHGRWGPCSYMIAVTMRRQSGPKRLPEWEEAAAVAAATQNMHLQSTKFPHLACYWSSWHDAVRDSPEMKDFLGLQDPDDKCMGFFIVAQVKPTCRKDRRMERDRSLLSVEWRP